jgi:hypothetical protein
MEAQLITKSVLERNSYLGAFEDQCFKWKAGTFFLVYLVSHILLLDDWKHDIISSYNVDQKYGFLTKFFKWAASPEW